MSPFPFHKKEGFSSPDFENFFTHLMNQLETLDRGAENMGEILKTILAFFKAENGSLFLYHAETQKFVLQAWVGAKPLNMSVSGDYEFITYLKQAHLVLFKDELNENRFIDVRPAGMNYFTQISCAAVVPLLVKNEWVGLLNVGRKAGGAGFREDDRSLLLMVGYWLSRYISHVLLYDKVRNQNKALSEVTELKNQLIANITHELRTPLTGILGLTELMIEGADGPLNDEQKNHLQLVWNSGQLLLNIVNNILSLIKVEASKGKMEMKRLDLFLIGKEVSHLFEGLMQKHQIVLVSHLTEGSCVYGDEEQIRAIFMNLVGNAVKFTKNGTIEIFMTRGSDRAKICVKDTGIGISEEDQAHIFDEFRQADGSITRRYGGTGLGLAIARKIVEIHGGRIWVESSAGRGSEFYFTLPLNPGRLQGVESATSPGHLGGMA